MQCVHSDSVTSGEFERTSTRVVYKRGSRGLDIQSEIERERERERKKERERHRKRQTDLK